jgi:hypothetical protein
MRTNSVFEFEGGDIRVWIEQESIHIRAWDENHRDPVELTSDSARQLAEKLNELADVIDG